MFARQPPSPDTLHGAGIARGHGSGGGGGHAYLGTDGRLCARLVLQERRLRAARCTQVCARPHAPTRPRPAPYAIARSASSTCACSASRRAAESAVDISNRRGHVTCVCVAQALGGKGAAAVTVEQRSSARLNIGGGRPPCRASLARSALTLSPRAPRPRPRASRRSCPARAAPRRCYERLPRRT